LQENIKEFRCFFRGLIRYNLAKKWTGKAFDIENPLMPSIMLAE
jgi:hypothetical protein